ncbi:hypothetical protein BDF19DRAFT_422678 [Syncephalis fuscata]|nr:hypothetical protein BDF19DRAFT_422678 [Syncephalis fuscata]
MSVAYRFVMIMNEMIAFETIQQIRADESRDAILSSIPDWESSRSQENALSGLCYRLAVAAQQRVLDLRLRAESAVRRQQLAEASANPAQMGNDALADQLSKASIAFYRADTDDKRLEECDSPALDPAFSPYIPIRQVVPFVWELVCEYARRHDIHDLPPMLPMEPSTSTSKSASMSSASSSSSALGGGAATTSTPRKSS